MTEITPKAKETELGCIIALAGSRLYRISSCGVMIPLVQSSQSAGWSVLTAGEDSRIRNKVRGADGSCIGCCLLLFNVFKEMEK